MLRSPAHMLEEIQNPSASTAAQALGTALHVLTLEPELFGWSYTESGQCAAVTKSTGLRCRSTGSVRREGEWYCGVRGHDPRPGEPTDSAIVLTHEEMVRVHGMRDALMAHELARGIIERSAGARELTAIWTDPATGVPCKARWDAPDHVAGVIGDIKSCEDASPAAFRRSVANYGYHRQHALYLDGAAELAGDTFDDFVFIAVESRPPYAVAIYRLPATAVEAGRHQLAGLLEQYQRCIQTGNYPAYPVDVVDLDLPAWAYRDIYEG